jgi:glycosyltransferase involved in cell wall biosynthesis
LNILLTNRVLAGRSGTEVVVRDLSFGLKQRGHTPLVYSPVLGSMAAEIRAHGVAVYDNLRDIAPTPDVIHGHHHPQTLAGLLRFPKTPAVFVCHDAVSWHDAPLIFPRVLRYVAVDHRCKRRFEGTPRVRPESVRVILNAVDLSRFTPRPSLPPRPLRAAIFSNYASRRTQLPAIAKACDSLGISLEVIGRASGTETLRPEQVLPRYDLVFAKARCALEAMAVGCAVVVCDFGGLGCMVSRETFAGLRQLNFGGGTLTRPLDAELIAAEIRKYDAAEAGVISERVRREADLSGAADEWIELYGEVLGEYANASDQHAEEMTALADYVAEWGYDARIAWENKRLGKYLNWPLVGFCLKKALKK